MAEQNGNLVTISFYEVYQQEHVYDLLDPKQPTISILVYKGKIQHKGLSQFSKFQSNLLQNFTNYMPACVVRVNQFKK